MNFYQQVYELVLQIPPGKVATYGQIATLLGRPHAARAVGYALHLAPDHLKVPWQRVINSQGKISPRSSLDMPHEPLIQRMLLEAEGVVFDKTGRVDLEKYLWEGKKKIGRGE
ncbi:MAG TPA: MGMT family protein [Candidatus Limnocylindrales bacterium]|nr:MGMT family protein [Candidatus Limnocylindrales bacterium]